MIEDNGKNVMLPRPLKQGEVYCHTCARFIEIKELTDHIKWHRNVNIPLEATTK